MKRVLAALFAALISTQMFSGAAKAALVDAPVDASEYITVGGVDWAWAGPCAPFAPSCGPIDLSYQGGQGWALASVAQVDAVIALFGLSNWVALFSGNDVCASRYFSDTWSNCDYGDANSGYIYNYSFGQPPNPAEEVFAVRVGMPPVPVPASLPLLLAGLGAFGALRLRRSRKAS